MKLKLIIIFFLLCANIIAASAGTLATYTATRSRSADISPDNERMAQIYPHELLIPDYDALPVGVNVFDGMTIKNTVHIKNNYSFVAFRGNIKQDHKNAKLVFDVSGNIDYFIIYFEPGVKIFFFDGTYIRLGGFYKLESRQNIFDDTLYLIGPEERSIKGDERFHVCDEPVAACAELNIPLTSRFKKA